MLRQGERVILLPGKLRQLFCQSAGASCIPPEAQPLQNPDAHLQCFAVTVRQGWIYHSTILAHTGNVLFMQDNDQAESNKRPPVEYYDMVSAPSFVDYRNPLTAMRLLRKSQCQQAEGIQVQRPVLIRHEATRFHVHPLRHFGEMHGVVRIEKSTCEDGRCRGIHQVRCPRWHNTEDAIKYVN